MTDRVPKHHLRQDICATRPAYREGRVPKAVKVYTVNNESKYVIVQGVPAVGATKELIQLCSSYGEVEEHHALDEYPCEDKYTEVYLIKYKKIQSARFCKRKLDDHSFFGGNLHVCYAPEYETIAETRGKLQERRRVIAGKIRQLKKETLHQTASSAQEGTSTSAGFQQPDDTNHDQNPTCPSFVTKSSYDSIWDANEVVDPNYSQPQTQSLQPVSGQDVANHYSSSSLDMASSFCFELPPPPTHSSPQQKPLESNKKYEYSRVPSKHSTLPPGFDGRLVRKDHQLHETQELEKESTLTKEAPKIINKNYKPSKQTLKFVPRQAVKRPLNDTNDLSKTGSTGDINKEIRKQAFILSKEQGPKDLSGRKEVESELRPGASASYHQTIRTIRSKISKVITDAVKPLQPD